MKKYVFYFLLILTKLVLAQNLEGMEGYFFIPSAEIKDDSKITLGVNYLDKSLVSFGNFKNSANQFFITINYLPFIETSVRITRLNGLPEDNNQAIGDRTPSIKVRFIEENSIVPSISVGLHDLLTVFGGESAVHNNSLYFVATKNFSSDQFVLNFSLTAGYGLKAFNAAHHNFIGFFGGIKIEFFNFVNLLLENDSVHSYVAFRSKIFKNINLLAGLVKLKTISGGISYSFQL